MTSTQTVLVIIGLVLGLVVLGVVIWLLNDVLRPLLRISADITEANKAPMLKKGIPGADQLSTTRRLAESVPPLALAYLSKLSLAPRAAAPPPPTPAAAAPTQARPTQEHLDAPSNLPAWKLYGR
jgi:hypothetical protein